MRTARISKVVVAAAGAAALLLAGEALAAHGKKTHPAPTKGPVAIPAGQRYAVTVWWNFSSPFSAGPLQAAIGKCGKSLGAAHAPEHGSFPGTLLVTGPMLQCLQGEGWRPIDLPQRG